MIRYCKLFIIVVVTGLCDENKNGNFVEFRCQTTGQSFILRCLRFLLSSCFAPCNSSISYFQMRVTVVLFVSVDDDPGGAAVWPSAA